MVLERTGRELTIVSEFCRTRRLRSHSPIVFANPATDVARALLLAPARHVYGALTILGGVAHMNLTAKTFHGVFHTP
jgi:hypothetical protein